MSLLYYLQMILKKVCMFYLVKKLDRHINTAWSVDGGRRAYLDVTLGNFKVKRYFSRGSYSAILIFASPFKEGQLLKERICSYRNKFLARLFSKKRSRYCHSPGAVGSSVVVGGLVRKLWHFLISQLLLKIFT